MLRKIANDLKAKGINIADDAIRLQMDSLMIQAVAQIKAGK